MTTSFPGFPKAFFSFLRELARNNDRAWFEANKARYKQEVAAPMSDFIAAMAPRLRKISPHYVADPRPHGGSMFRIYRDTRFSKDKRPYKEHVACQFRHQAGRDAHAPGFYVHLAPKEVRVGGGIWLPPGAELRAVREAIARDPAGWSRVLGNRRFKAAFDGVRGDALVRTPRGFDDDHRHIADIKRKTFFVMRESTAAAAGESGFIDEVEDTLGAAAPLMKFVCKALHLPF